MTSEDWYIIQHINSVVLYGDWLSCVTLISLNVLLVIAVWFYQNNVYWLFINLTMPYQLHWICSFFDRVICEWVNDVLVRMWKEEITVYFKVLSQQKKITKKLSLKSQVWPKIWIQGLLNAVKSISSNNFTMIFSKIMLNSSSAKIVEFSQLMKNLHWHEVQNNSSQKQKQLSFCCP